MSLDSKDFLKSLKNTIDLLKSTGMNDSDVSSLLSCGEVVIESEDRIYLDNIEENLRQLDLGVNVSSTWSHKRSLYLLGIAL